MYQNYHLQTLNRMKKTPVERPFYKKYPSVKKEWFPENAGRWTEMTNVIRELM